MPVPAPETPRVPGSPAKHTMFSVVMPTWDRKNDLSEAVDSVLMQKETEFEIIVIDNGSQDGTPGYCRDLAAREPRFKWFRFDRNRGITAAENFGISKAAGDIIFCLDDDELIEDDHLLKNVECLEQDWDLLNIGITNAETGAWEHFIFSQRKAKNLHKTFYVNNFGNGTVFIKKEVIRKIGVFEEGYFRQGHENEYALRAVLHGFNILYCPQLVLRHKTSAFRHKNRKVPYYMLRNTMLKNYKYFRGWRLLLLQAWQVAQSCARIFIGRMPPRMLAAALRDYAALKKACPRMLDYEPAAMERYFFVSRKVATTPGDIGRLGFFQYYVRGITRFF